MERQKAERGQYAEIKLSMILWFAGFAMYDKLENCLPQQPNWVLPRLWGRPRRPAAATTKMSTTTTATAMGAASKMGAKETKTDPNPMARYAAIAIIIRF